MQKRVNEIIDQMRQGKHIQSAWNTNILWAHENTRTYTGR